MKHSCTIACALFILISSACLAQGTTQDHINQFIPKPVPQSPNVSSLGKYGSYEVSHYTGLPEISIPIFEVKSGSLTVPITLSYHASGFRTTDVAGWVGLGWSLSAGGHIARDVRGAPDELSYYNTPLLPTPSGCLNSVYLSQAASGIKDTQPDIFSYSLPGKSGSFMLGQQGGRPYTIPYEPFLISHTKPEGTSPFDLDQFQMTNDKGVIHRFGKNSSAAISYETTTADRGSLVSSTARTAWHLMEILAPNSDDMITFNYQDIGTAASNDITSVISVSDGCITSNNRPCPPTQVTTSRVNSYSTITQKGISQIFFEGGRVDFVLAKPCRLDQVCNSYQPGLKALEQINIYSEVAGVYNLVKSTKFIYSYFTNTGGTSSMQLMLKGIQLLDNNGVVVNNHTFEYYTNTLSWSAANPFSRDFFGYYNGKANSDLIPTQQIQVMQDNGFLRDLTIGSADRSTVTNYMTEGVLKRIYFPTGGFTEFEFETHQYQENGVSKYAGGLRVGKISTFESAGATPIVKSYKYGVGESGPGVKNFIDKINYYTSESYYIERCPLPGLCRNPYPGDLSYRTRSFHSNPLISATAQDGSTVVYPVVTEYYGSPAANIGKIVYTYDNGQYNSIDVIQAIEGPFSPQNYRNSYAWKRGRLTSKTIFDQSLNKVSETSIGYTIFQAQEKLMGMATEDTKYYVYDPVTTNGVACKNELGGTTDPRDILWRNYYQSSGALRETSTTEKIFENGNPARFVSKTTTRTYDPVYLQPTSSTVTSVPDRELIVTNTSYPFSYSYSGNETGVVQALRILKEKNALDVPVETFAVRKDINGTNARVISGNINTFVLSPYSNSKVQPQKTFVWETSARSLASYKLSAVSGNNFTMDSGYQPRVDFKSYDKNGNVSEVARINNVITSYIWGYHSSLPIAEVSNCGTDTRPDNPSYIPKLFHSSFEDAGLTHPDAKTGIRVSKGPVTIWKPSAPGNYLLSWWQKTGTDPWTYMEQTVTGGGGTTTIGSSANIIDEVRLYPATAKMTTYTYDPVYGITSTTDVNSQTTRYSYDNVGRLAAIWDDRGNLLKTYQYHFNDQQH